MSQGPERLAAEFLRSQPVFRSSDIAVRTVRGLLHFLGTRGLLSVDAPPGPWRVERDQNADVVTPPVYRVHWSSRVKFETTSIHEAAAVRDALNRLAAAAGVSLPDSGDAPLTRCLDNIVKVMRNPSIPHDYALSEIQDYLTIAGYDVPLRSYHDSEDVPRCDEGCESDHVGNIYHSATCRRRAALGSAPRETPDA